MEVLKVRSCSPLVAGASGRGRPGQRTAAMGRGRGGHAPRAALLSLCALCLLAECGSITWDVEHALACKAPTGQLDDAQCDVHAVESANSKQLHNILEELSNTTYFRLMHINLDGKCRFFNQAVAEAKCSAGAPPPPPSPFADPFSVSPDQEQPTMCYSPHWWTNGAKSSTT